MTPVEAPRAGASSGAIGERLGLLVGSRPFDHAVILGLTAYLLVGPFQRHPPPGWVDAGMYLGYFRDLPDLIARYGQTYHSNRWLFTLAGYGAYHLFSPPVANLVLVAGFHLAVLYAFRALLLPFCTPGVTKLALVLVGPSPLVVAAVTRTYVDGLTMALILAGLAALLRGVLWPPSGKGLFVAGAAFTLAVLTQPASAAPILAGVAATALVWRSEAIRALRAAGGAVLGALCVVMAYAGLSYAIVGKANFVGPSFRLGSRMLNVIRTFGYPTWSVLPGATRLWFLVGVTLGCGALLLGRRRAVAERPEARRLLYWSFLGTVATIGCVSLSDLWAKTSILQLTYVAPYLLPLVFVMLGAALQELVGSDPLRLLPAAGALAPLLAWGSAVVSREWGPENLAYPALGIGGLLVLGGGAFWVAVGGRARAGRAVLGLFVVSSVLQGVNLDTRHIFSDPEVRFADSARCLHGVADFIGPAIAGRPVLFWFNRQGYNEARNRPRPWLAPQGGVYPWFIEGKRADLNLCDSVNALYLWDRSHLGGNLPELSSRRVAKLKHASRDSRVFVVLLSDRLAELTEATAALGRMGFPLETPGTREIVSGRVALWVRLIRVDTSPSVLRMDTNGDGRPDLWQRWKGARLAFEDVDTDLDGTPDIQRKYRRDGKVAFSRPLPRD